MNRKVVHIFGMLMLVATSTTAAASVVRRLPSVGQNNYYSAASRIVGGQDAAVGEFPYHVSLHDIRSQSHVCGGSIIRPNWILTAAHCIHGTDPADIRVLVGTKRLDGGRSYNVSAWFLHDEDYNFFHSLANDIALIRLSESLRFTTNVQPIALGNCEYIAPGRPVIVSGWGRLEEDGKIPNNLQFLHMTTLSSDNCSSYFYRSALKTDTMICAYSDDRNNSSGLCHGDSGGALVSGGDVVIGVFSWGYLCANGYPDVFTRVAPYLAWIKQVIGD